MQSTTFISEILLIETSNRRISYSKKRKDFLFSSYAISDSLLNLIRKAQRAIFLERELLATLLQRFIRDRVEKNQISIH